MLVSKSFHLRQNFSDIVEYMYPSLIEISEKDYTLIYV